MGEKVKVNLGCGRAVVSGWVNIDKSLGVYVRRFPPLRIILRLLSVLRLIGKGTTYDNLPADVTVMRRDATRRLPFDDDTVDYIFTSHMLEHLTQRKAIRVLAECYRTLKPGGVLRVVLPDLGFFIDEYIKGKQAGNLTAADSFMKRMQLHGIGDSRPLLSRILEKGHQWMFDFDSLAYYLNEIGFKGVKKCEAGQGDFPDLQLLGEGETHPDSFYLEAKKQR